MAIMILFIDTNIFLSFYHFTSDDLEELDKLRILIKKKRLTLLLPDQVVSEFRRNREAKISDALLRFRERSLNLEYPNLTKSYAEYGQLTKLQHAFGEAHAGLVQRIVADARAGGLAADHTIDGIFEAATQIEISGDILESARKRVALGSRLARPA